MSSSNTQSLVVHAIGVLEEDTEMTTTEQNTISNRMMEDMDPVGTVDGGNNIVRFGVNRELHGSWSLILAGIGWPVIILSCLSNVCLTALVLSYCCKYKNLKRKTYTRVPRRGN